MQTTMKELYLLVQEGKTAKEILDLTKISSKARLEQLCNRLSWEKKELINVPGLYEPTIRNLKLKQSGIHIPTSQLEGQYPVGSEFLIEKHDDHIVLRLVPNSGIEQA